MTAHDGCLLVQLWPPKESEPLGARPLPRAPRSAAVARLLALLVTIVLALGLLTRVVAPRLLAGVAATAVLKGVFGAGLALLASLFFAASILGRVSKKPAIVRLLVRAGHLELQTEGGRFPIAPRTIPRVSNEMARVVMATRGGDGQPATWRIEYGGGTGEYYELVTIAAHEKPIALEHAAARTRGALATLPFEA